jgi:hypothetical protein
MSALGISRLPFDLTALAKPFFRVQMGSFVDYPTARYGNRAATALAQLYI